MSTLAKGSERLSKRIEPAEGHTYTANDFRQGTDLPRQSRRSRRRAAQRYSTSQPSTPLSADPLVGVPGITGDVVADEPVALDLEEPLGEPEPEPRYRSRYMAEKGRTTPDTATARRRTPDHRYVLGELRRIAIFGVLMLTILIVATLLLR